jgi:sulfite exporter TauE/SafE
MSWLETLAAFAALGLASAPHCAFMCGPLAVHGCRRGERTHASLTLQYMLGRASSYFFLGVVAGSVGVLSFGAVGRGFTLVLCELIAVLLLMEAAARFFPGRFGLRRARLPRLFERARAWFPTRGLALGLATGFLPCAALLAAVLLAATAELPLAAGVGMLVFALASAPGLLVPIVAGGWFARAVGPRAARVAGMKLAGVALLALALWIGARPFLHSSHATHASSGVGNAVSAHCAPAGLHVPSDAAAVAEPPHD